MSSIMIDHEHSCVTWFLAVRVRVCSEDESEGEGEGEGEGEADNHDCLLMVKLGLWGDH
jgi:hypothetical protein